MTERKKALVVGATGVVGRRLAEYIDGLDSWEVVGLSRRAAIGGDRVLRISVDLSNREETEAALRHLDDVTQFFTRRASITLKASRNRSRPTPLCLEI